MRTAVLYLRTLHSTILENTEAYCEGYVPARATKYPAHHREVGKMAKEPFSDPEHYLKIAKGHLERVRRAWDPPDWTDLGTYGLYCLEALVRAAALKSGETPIRTHWGKVDQAKNLSKKHKLPDVENLMTELNDMRKANAYGDEDFDESEYNAEDICRQIEEYFSEVSSFLKK